MAAGSTVLGKVGGVVLAVTPVTVVMAGTAVLAQTAGQQTARAVLVVVEAAMLLPRTHLPVAAV